MVKDILSAVASGFRFVVVSMPTGSDKTFIELFMAYKVLKESSNGVLVVGSIEVFLQLGMFLSCRPRYLGYI